MATVIKTRNVSEENEMNSPRDRDLSAEDVDNQQKCVSVFEVKHGVIDEPRESDLDALQKSFEKKLDLNNDNVETISRGPHGGKPAPQGTHERDPPSKFVRTVAAETQPRIQKNSINATSFNCPTNGGYPSCFPNFNSILKYVDESAHSKISNGSNFMTAGEFFQDKGQITDEPTHFALLNPNIVYDEHGQIIQQNNKRKSSGQYLHQLPIQEYPFQIPLHVSGQNMTPFNPSSIIRNSQPLQIDLTYNNLPSNTGLCQKLSNFEFLNCTRSQIFQNVQKTPSAFPPQQPQPYKQQPHQQQPHQQQPHQQQPNQQPHQQQPNQQPHQQQPHQQQPHQQQPNQQQPHQQQPNQQQPHQQQHSFNSNPYIPCIDQWRNIAHRQSPMDSPVFSSKINTGNRVSSVQFVSYPGNNSVRLVNLEDKRTMKTFIDEAERLNSGNAVKHGTMACEMPRQYAGIALPVRTDASLGLYISHPTSQLKTIDQSPVLMNPSKAQNGYNMGSINHNVYLPNSSVGLSYESRTNRTPDSNVNIVPKSGQLNQSEKQFDTSQKAATGHQKSVVHQPIKTIPTVPDVKANQDFNLDDISFGLNEEELQSLFEEYTSSGFDWKDEDFLKQPELSLTPTLSETNLRSTPESYGSFIPDIYPDFESQFPPNGYDFQNPNSIESCPRQLESLENVIIHPSMLQSLFQDYFDGSTHNNSISALSGMPVNDSATPIEGFHSITSSSIGQRVDATALSPHTGSTSSNIEKVKGYARSLESQIEGRADHSPLVANYTDERLMTQDEDGDNILHIAVINDKPEIIQDVLTRVKDKDELRKKIVETKNELGQTPLCLAVVENQPVMVQSLVASGADVGVPILSRKNKSFTRPLHFAASKGQLWMDCLRELLACPNIDVNSLDSDGKTPLLCAVKEHGTTYKGKNINSIPSIELLVKRGADLNKADGCFDMTALHYAISSKSLDLVSCLVSLASTGGPPSTLLANNSRSKGVTGVSTLAKMLGAKTGTGYSALHLAVGLNMKEDMEQLKIIQLLLSKGADPSSKNSEGQLPRELTKNQKVIEILKGIGLRRKPSPPLKSPSDAFHHSPGTMSSHSPRSVTSQGRLPSINGQFSPANQIPSPMQHII